MLWWTYLQQSQSFTRLLGEKRKRKVKKSSSGDYYTDDILPSICNHCKNDMNAATPASYQAKDQGAPKSGDLSICGYCGEMAIFDDAEGRLRELEKKDEELICSKIGNQQYNQIVEFCAEIRALYNGKKKIKLEQL